jgi:hypothetical protein
LFSFCSFFSLLSFSFSFFSFFFVSPGLGTQILLANFLAQTEALMCGKSMAAVEAELASMPAAARAAIAPHKVC